MAIRRRIVRNEAYAYSANRLSPGVGAIHLYPGQKKLGRALAWMRWWHWAGLATALLLVVDARI